MRSEEFWQEFWQLDEKTQKWVMEMNDKANKVIDEHDKRARRFKSATKALIVLSLILFAISIHLYNQWQEAETMFAMSEAVAESYRLDAQHYQQKYYELLSR